MSEFSEFIVYVDEAGDHGPVSKEFPVFVLAFCVFKKKEYANVVTSYMHRLKFKHFGHDTTVLHEREIRKALPPFDILLNKSRREVFMDDLSKLIEVSPFTLIAVVIEKEKLAKRHNTPPNPYHLALEYGLERVERMRGDAGDTGTLHVVFEARGKRQDEELELEFRRVCATNATRKVLEFEPVFSKKAANHCGLQLADLMARPIGLHVMRPEQPNRSFDILATKFRRSPEGQIEGFGLKCYP